MNTSAINLHTKITGIVFWGLALIGIIACVVLMQIVEPVVTERYNKHFYEASVRSEFLLQTNPDLSSERLRAELDFVRKDTGVDAFEISSGMDIIVIGKIHPEAGSRSILIQYANNEASPENHELVVVMYQPSAADTLANIRKNVIIGMAALFFLFGMVLQKILRRMLTNPYARMIKIASGFIDNPDGRFDDSRGDEFGFLASFINKALDDLVAKQHELESALTRAVDSERALFAEKEHAEVTLSSIADAVVTTDENGEIAYVNPVSEALLGCDLASIRGKRLSDVVDLFSEETDLLVDDSCIECIRTNSIVRDQGTQRLVRRDGTYLEVQTSAAPLRDGIGEVIGAVLVLHDVHEAHVLARQLSYQASHDPLTNLINRREFENQIHDVLESSTMRGIGCALCYLDLDQFKIVNDTCGHIAGDELLRQLTHQLSTIIRDTDTLARLGGDEFGVLLRGCSTADATRIADSMCQLVKEFRFAWEDKSFDIGVSIGLVPLHETTMDMVGALSAADVACYAAKDHGRGRVYVYESNDMELERRRGELVWATQISDALQEDRFRLYFQPIVPLSSRDTLSSHCEILLRGVDKNGKIIPPGAFLPAAERYKLMPAIDRWVINTLFLHYGDDIRNRHAKARFSGTGKHTGPISVNLSGASINEAGFLDFIRKKIEKFNIPPAALCFEITETVAVANLVEASEFIHDLKRIGCSFALDDFGSGMSSFSYLKNLDVDYLKIDGSYVKDLVHDPIDRAMVEAVNQIGHAMGIATIAEYVEDEAIFGALSAMGVDYAQGYGIARPAPIDGLFAKDRSQTIEVLA